VTQDSSGKTPGNRRSEEQAQLKYQAVFDRANDGIFIHDVQTSELLEANQRACTALGYSLDELKRTHLGAVSANEAPYTIEEAKYRMKMALAGEPQLFEWKARKKNGETFWTEVNTRRIKIGDEDRLVSIIRDIDQRKRAEEEQRRMESQVQHVQKLESLGVLAGGIAHDFNNLLMGILGNADLAREVVPATSPARELIGDIILAAKKSADLCRQLLAYSGRGRIDLKTRHLSDVVRDLSRMLEVSVTKKAELTYDLAAKLPPVRADVSQLSQVLMNLITNASEAVGDTPGTISLTTGVEVCDRSSLQSTCLGQDLPEGRYCFIEVADSGCGMNAEIKDRIFDPFFTTKFTGRGLGLSAVLGIVRGHRGTIRIESEPGAGTTITVLLPAAAGNDLAAAGESTAGRQAAANDSWRGNGTVLLVDDEQEVRTVARRMLELLGFSVLVAANGRQAIEIYRERAAGICCVVLDLTMPHMDGKETFHELCRIDGDVRVVLASGYNEREVTERFTEQAPARYIQKPFTAAALAETLRKTLE